MAEARQVAGLKLAVKPDGKIEIDWSSGKNIKHSHLILSMWIKSENSGILNVVLIIFYS